MCGVRRFAVRKRKGICFVEARVSVISTRARWWALGRAGGGIGAYAEGYFNRPAAVLNPRPKAVGANFQSGSARVAGRTSLVYFTSQKVVYVPEPSALWIGGLRVFDWLIGAPPRNARGAGVQSGKGSSCARF